MKNECLWGVNIEFKISMRKVKSLLKQTTPLQICSAPFLNSPESTFLFAAERKRFSKRLRRVRCFGWLDAFDDFFVLLFPLKIFFHPYSNFLYFFIRNFFKEQNPSPHNLKKGSNSIINYSTGKLLKREKKFPSAKLGIYRFLKLRELLNTNIT